MKVIVGLGNPGKQYAGTPHNIGFDVVDELADRLGIRFRRSLRFQARTAQGMHAGEAVLLVKPQTYMNRSGEAVSVVVRYRKVSVSDVLVALDDADLEFGRLRVRPGGRSGGHRGLESVIRLLGDHGFARVRIGIGRCDRGGELVDHVLRRFSEEEQAQAAPVVRRAADAIMRVLDAGVEAAMNDFNGPLPEIRGG